VAAGADAILRIEGLIKSFGGVSAIRDVSLSFETGSLTAIIGPNGAGKTTFFNLISGALRPSSGRIVFDGRDLVGLDRTEIMFRGIARAFQVASIFPTLTVDESLRAAVTAHRRLALRMGRRFPLPETRERAEEVIEMLGLAPVRDVLSCELSHGDQKLLDIALALVLRPKVLLLDEPTAGMGPEERLQMMDKIHRQWEREAMTLIFIEHDMDIVFRVAQSIRVLSYGAVLAEGTPEQIRTNPAVIEAYLGAEVKEATS
jgi:branched-chain amino acid transport system ATP-binding protein